jgi:hypothetical protein
VGHELDAREAAQDSTQNLSGARRMEAMCNKKCDRPGHRKFDVE